MSILVNSTKVPETPGGFNFKSILFCCCNKDTVEPSATVQCAVIPEEIARVQSTEEVETPIEEMMDSTTDNTNLESLDSVNEVPSTQFVLDPEPEPVFNKEDSEDFDTISEYDVNMAVVKDQEIVEKTKTAELKLRMGYDSEKSSLNITIVDSFDLARPSSSTNSIRERVIADVPPVLAYSVHILVLPARKLRFKTKMRQGPDPYFDEIIKVPKVRLEDIKKWSLRFRLYGSMRNAMKGIIGEGFIIMDSLNLEARSECRIALMNHIPNIPENIVSTIMSTSKCDRGSMLSLDSIDRMTSLLEGDPEPEVLIGLAYSFNTGRLTMEIIRGNKFPKLKDKLPDTFIGVVVTSSKGEEIASSKTSVKKGTCDPIFEEKFIYQILVYQLEETTVTVTGYHKKSMGKASMFGSFVMGNKNSGDEERSHWKDLISSQCSDQILRWHSLHPLTQDKKKNDNGK